MNPNVCLSVLSVGCRLTGITCRIVYGSNVLHQDNTEMIALIPYEPKQKSIIFIYNIYVERTNYDLEDFDIEIISMS